MTADEDLTAVEFLQKYKDRIAYVHVTWTWAHDYYAEVDTEKVSWHFELWGHKYPAGFSFSAEVVDPEYCFSGTYDEALKYFSQYENWDGMFKESDIYNGALVKEYCNDTYCLDEPSEMNSQEVYLNIESNGICFWKDNKLCSPESYKEAVLKKEEEPDEEGDE